MLASAGKTKISWHLVVLLYPGLDSSQFVVMIRRSDEFKWSITRVIKAHGEEASKRNSWISMGKKTGEGLLGLEQGRWSQKKGWWEACLNTVATRVVREHVMTTLFVPRGKIYTDIYSFLVIDLSGR
jgi:hypothetical protein